MRLSTISTFLKLGTGALGISVAGVATTYEITKRNAINNIRDHKLEVGPWQNTIYAPYGIVKDGKYVSEPHAYRFKDLTKITTAANPTILFIKLCSLLTLNDFALMEKYCASHCHEATIKWQWEEIKTGNLGHIKKLDSSYFDAEKLSPKEKEMVDYYKEIVKIGVTFHRMHNEMVSLYFKRDFGLTDFPRIFFGYPDPKIQTVQNGGIGILYGNGSFFATPWGTINIGHIDLTNEMYRKNISNLFNIRELSTSNNFNNLFSLWGTKNIKFLSLGKNSQGTTLPQVEIIEDAGVKIGRAEVKTSWNNIRNLVYKKAIEELDLIRKESEY